MKSLPSHPTLAPGSIVGAARWPYSGAHPDCWGEPWRGVLLAVDDPEAWRGGMGLGVNPDPEAVRAHVAWCMEAIPSFGESVPVSWDFGPNGRRVYWERASDVRPYAEDFAAWAWAREAARVARGTGSGLRLHVA